MALGASCHLLNCWRFDSLRRPEMSIRMDWCLLLYISATKSSLLCCKAHLWTSSSWHNLEIWSQLGDSINFVGK